MPDDLVLRGPHAERALPDRRRDRLEGGARHDDDRRQRHQRQHHAADERRRPRQPEEVEEHREAEQPEHDGGDGGEVVDVHLDDVRHPVLGGELLEVDGRRDAHRERDEEADEERVERAGDGAPQPRKLGKARVVVGEESPVEDRLDVPLPLHLFEDGRLEVRHAATALR